LDQSYAERQNDRLKLFDDKQMENQIRQVYEMQEINAKVY
jgi:hypothetical protein